MIRVLAVGAKGQLGRELEKVTHQYGFDFVGVDLPEFDIANKYQVYSLVDKYKPIVIVNASAFTAVDKAETEPALAFAVNSKGPQYLANACRQIDIPLIHISTDYVFNGKKRSPYHEDDSVSPLGVYGKSKEAGEVAVRGELESHIIIRTSWLYGVEGQNFVKTMLRLGKDKKVIRVVADQFGCPTYAADLAFAIHEIIEQINLGARNKWGTYHFCGGGRTSWYGFAEAIFELARSKTRLTVEKVEPITTEEFPTPAKRPANSVLDCSRINKAFGIQIRPWKVSLAEMLDALLEPNSKKCRRSWQGAKR